MQCELSAQNYRNYLSLSLSRRKLCCLTIWFRGWCPWSLAAWDATGSSSQAAMRGSIARRKKQVCLLSTTWPTFSICFVIIFINPRILVVILGSSYWDSQIYARLYCALWSSDGIRQSRDILQNNDHILHVKLTFLFFSFSFKNVNSLNCLPWLDVTVILKYGEIEAEYNHDKICIYCSKDDNCYLDSDHCCPFVMDATKRIDLRKWVHFVPGVVKTINR